MASEAVFFNVLIQNSIIMIHTVHQRLYNTFEHGSSSQVLDLKLFV